MYVDSESPWMGQAFTKSRLVDGAGGVSLWLESRALIVGTLMVVQIKLTKDGNVLLREMVRRTQFPASP